MPLSDTLVRSDSAGLSSAEARQRLQAQTSSTRRRRHHPALRLFVAQFKSPIIIILAAATVVAMVLGDATDGAVILAIIAASSCLSFVQEHRAGKAVAALLERVRVEVHVLRDGHEVAVATDEVVVDDIVILRPGDIVPADARVVVSQRLLVDEAALTGESYPVEKSVGGHRPDEVALTRSDEVYLGTHVVSGTGSVRVVATGNATKFGLVAAKLAEADPVTRFERGLTAFGLMLLRAMVVLVTGVFVANVLLDRSFTDSLLFSLALAVGLTPQLLPAIVAISLSNGAREMAKRQVIVKRLDAIEDFGAMTVLCTDKTGTLTEGAARLEHAVGLDGTPNADVLYLARVNASLQEGFANPLDRAVLRDAPELDLPVKIAEIPYEPERRRLSVLIAGQPPVLVTKGAFAEVVALCTSARVGDRDLAMASVRADLDKRFGELSAAGYRVLALATRDLPGRDDVAADDEAAMTLRGLLAFADPPKEGAPEAIQQLSGIGISVRLVTGDNHLAALHVARSVGLNTDETLCGSQIAVMDDATLRDRAANCIVFAEIDPLQKERIVTALRATGETVGFLGDGINDAAALHVADVGISVDTAVDVAKQSAAIVLLDKSLSVVADGVREGRQIFANTLKYVRVTTSANFGNVMSMAAATVFLPFLPLLPRQILLLNFLSDIPGTTICADEVDPEDLDAPREWDTASIRRFMILFGCLSSVFDMFVFVVMRGPFHAHAGLFRSAWFIESTATELVVMLVLRTARPFWRSRPSRTLLTTSIAVAVVTVALPFSPLAAPLGLVAVPATVVLTLVALTALYAAANEGLKQRFAGPRALRLDPRSSHD